MSLIIVVTFCVLVGWTFGLATAFIRGNDDLAGFFQWAVLSTVVLLLGEAVFYLIMYLLFGWR